jgi:hypothetical protein
LAVDKLGRMNIIINIKIKETEKKKCGLSGRSKARKTCRNLLIKIVAKFNGTKSLSIMVGELNIRDLSGFIKDDGYMTFITLIF